MPAHDKNCQRPGLGKNDRSLARVFRSIIRVDSKAKYLAAAIKDGQAQISTLHDEEALSDFIARIKKRYDELVVIDLTDKNRAMITENL